MTFVAHLRSPSGIVVLETILVACLMFATFSVLVRVTDMETVGLWVLVNAVLGFSRAADFWSRGLASFVGEARGKGQLDVAAGFVSTAVLSGVAGYAVMAACGAGVIWFLAESLAGEANAMLVRDIVPLMAFTFWILAIAGTYGGAFLAFGKPFLKASQTVGGAAVFLILAAILAPRYGIWGILIAQALQGGLVFVYAAIVFHTHVVPGSKASWRINEFRELASFGSKAILVGALQLAIEPVIRLLTSHFGGLGAVAAVELASRVIAVARGVITSLGQILVPEFARLGASVALEPVYRDSSRMFLLASISAFSLLASAGPALEETVLGQSGTEFLAFLWLLSIGWFGNTVVSPAYFLLLSQRRMRPLFWSHLIMSAGAVGLGVLGGSVAGAVGAIAGASVALIIASLYLFTVTDAAGRGIFGLFHSLLAEPLRLMPLLAAAAAVIAIDGAGLLQDDAMLRFAGYAAGIGVTMLACLVFADVRGMGQLASRVR